MAVSIRERLFLSAPRINMKYLLPLTQTAEILHPVTVKTEVIGVSSALQPITKRKTHYDSR